MAEADDEQIIQVGTYQRTIQAREVTFTCTHCGQETTIQQYPGSPPRYCSLECKRAVHRVRDRERKARQRAAARAAESSALSDTRDQPSDTTLPADLPPDAAAPPLPASLSDPLAQPSDRMTAPSLSTTPGFLPFNNGRI